MDYNAPKMKLLRKNLRNNGTSAEATLWNALKCRQIDGFKWRRQYSVGSYILDFYCVEARLGIELDGSPHFTPDGMEKDFLRRLGAFLLQKRNLTTRNYVFLAIYFL